MAFQAKISDERKRLNITISEKDHARLARMAQDAGINQGDAIHLLLELVDFIEATERERGIFREYKTPEQTSVSALESFAFWVAWKLGIANEGAFNLAMQLAANQRIGHMQRDGLALIDGFYWSHQNSHEMTESDDNNS